MTSHSNGLKYSPFELEQMLDSIVVLVDTREQPGKRFDQRTQSFGFPFVRHKLDQGDYSYKWTDLDGVEHMMDSKIVIERKMSLNELASNFGKNRDRFTREFERAKELGTKVYLIVEDDGWEDAYNGTYGKDPDHRSRLSPNSMIGSINAWENRYDMRIRLCKHSRTGRMIRDIFYYHLKEILQSEVEDERVD